MRTQGVVGSEHLGLPNSMPGHLPGILYLTVTRIIKSLSGNWPGVYLARHYAL